jgi:hypothetical protein
MSLRRARTRTLRAAVAVFLSLMLVVMTAPAVSAAGSGDGRITVTPTTATYGATGQTFTFDFWNDEATVFLGPILGSHGSKVALTIPAGWTPPTTAAGAGHIGVAEGAFTYVWLLHPQNACDPGSTSITGSGPWTITIPMTCWPNDHLTITYSGVTVPAAMTYTFTTRTQGTVTALANIDGQPTVTVNKADQTIAFDPAPTGAKVGSSGVSVHATATSGLAVSYSSTTVSICTVNASTGALTLLAEGTCTIAADQAGNGTYAAASQVTQNVAVGVAPVPQLTMVAAAAQPSFANAGDTIDYTFTLTNTGNVTLDGLFTVTSDKVANATCPETPSGLASGASIVCTGTYAITQADVDAGSVVVTAIGHGFSGRTPIVTAAAVVTVPKAQTQTVLAATSVPSRAVTAPPTSTANDSPSNSSAPILPLLICFAFAGLGLLAVQAQRHTLRR